MIGNSLLSSKLGRVPVIGMVAPWGQRCGISQYTENMVAAMKLYGYEVKVCANYPYGQVTRGDDDYVKRCFEIEIYTNRNNFDYEAAEEHLRDCYIIHIQGESALYARDYIPNLQKIFSKKKIIITLHSTFAPAMFMKKVDFFLAHSVGVLGAFGIPEHKGAVQYMPSPVVEYTPPKPVKDELLLRTFGLGRSQDEVVAEAVNILNSNREESEMPKFTHESVEGSHHWMSLPMLLNWVKEAHACVLYYPPVSANVTSSAAYLALACGRPLVVSDTNWFSRLSPEHVVFAGHNVKKLCEGLDDLWEDYDGFVARSKKYAEWLREQRSYVSVVDFLDKVYFEVMSR